MALDSLLPLIQQTYPQFSSGIEQLYPRIHAFLEQNPRMYEMARNFLSQGGLSSLSGMGSGGGQPQNRPPQPGNPLPYPGIPIGDFDPNPDVGGQAGPGIPSATNVPQVAQDGYAQAYNRYLQAQQQRPQLPQRPPIDIGEWDPPVPNRFGQMYQNAGITSLMR